MDHEDQRVADYPERADYRYDHAVANDAPDVRLGGPQIVVLGGISQGLWSEINSVSHAIRITLARRYRSPFAQHDHAAHLGNIREFHRAPFRYWSTRDERSRPIFFVEAKPFNGRTSRTSGEPLLATSEEGFRRLAKNYGSARFSGGHRSLTNA